MFKSINNYYSDVFSDFDIKDTLMGFEVYRSFGDFFLKKGLLEKSVTCYDKALLLKKNDQYCLTKRSKAQVGLNHLDLALQDAEASIKQNASNFQAILQKARVHYLSGDFETSLSFYHRGYLLRPKVYEFLMGIHNSEKAIRKSLNASTTFHFRSQEEYAQFYEFARNFDSYDPKQEYEIFNTKKSRRTKKSIVRVVPKFSHVNFKRLMSDRQTDYQFLEQFLLENTEHLAIVNTNQIRFQRSKMNHFEEFIPSITTVNKVPISHYAATTKEINQETVDCLDLMNKRCEFWHMHNPNTVRNKEKKRTLTRRWSLLSYDTNESFKNICDNIDMVYTKQERGNHEGAIAQLKKIIHSIQSGIPEKTDHLKGKRTIIATLYSLMGNSYIELKKYQLGIDCHMKDLEIAVEKRSTFLTSRAADNLARAYAFMKDYRKASDLLSTRLMRSRSVLESIWIRYTISKCEYLLKNYVESLNQAEQCFTLVECSKNPDMDIWYIRSCILIGQSEFYLKNYIETQDRYNLALEKAKELGLQDCFKELEVALNNLRKIISKQEATEKDQRKSVTLSGDDSDLIEDEYEIMKMRNLYSALVAKRNKSQGRTVCAFNESSESSDS